MLLSSMVVQEVTYMCFMYTNKSYEIWMVMPGNPAELSEG